ncbi:MAG: hypothetical protein KIT09_09155 [Bryobacteraceae bacterium]|nr:hypothetical protein [Bryobacteraceae bacterium]
MRRTAQLAIACFTIVLLSTVCLGQQMGFGGPSILSGNGGAPLGRVTGGAPLGFRPFGGLSYRYDNALGEFLTEDARSRNFYALNGMWGLYGVHRGERYLVGIDYTGSYRQYSGSPARNGANHFGSISYVQQVGPATDIFAAAGVSSFRYGLITSQTSLLFDALPDVSTPELEFFDARTKSYRSSAGVRHRLGERTSLQVNGSGFEVQRARNLISTRGGMGSASLSYQIAHNIRIGGSYGYNYFYYPNGYGDSNVQSVSFHYNHQLSPEWQFSANAGGIRAENERLRQVVLDPEVAALTGQSAALETSHTILHRPTLGVTLMRQFQRSNFSMFFRRSARPGNGFISTSLNETWGATYGFTATERLHVSATFSGSSLSAMNQHVGRYTIVGGGVGFTYRLFSIVNLTSHIDARHWVVTDSNLRRNRVGAFIGIVISPGETPLAIW